MNSGSSAFVKEENNKRDSYRNHLIACSNTFFK